MCKTNDIKILIYFDTPVRALPESYRSKKIHYKYESNPENISTKAIEFYPDALFIDEKCKDCTDLLMTIKKNFGDKVKIILFSDNYNVDYVNEILIAGAYDVIEKPITEKSFLIVLYKVLKEIQSKNDYRILIQNFINSESVLNEKNTILETILDMLSHDSRNLFFNIFSLVKQVRDENIRSLLEECIDELYQSTMEAVGYLGSRKRILSLVEVVRNLKLTSNRISLSECKRIKFIHSKFYFLFIETSLLMKNAIINLIENALKFSPDDKFVKIEIFRKEEEIFINIVDFGEGIPDGEKSKIFDKFYRRKKTEKIEGSGRGLWITRNLIRKEGGTLTVKDNPEGGAVFTIKLPAFKIDDYDKDFHRIIDWFIIPPDDLLKKASVIRSMILYEMDEENYDIDSIVFANLLDYIRKEKKEKNKKSFIKKLVALKKKNPKGKTVLIVDDSLYVHYYLGAFFTEFGYHIIDFAQNGKDGVDSFKRYKPDLITMDYTMPAMTGLEAACKIFGIDQKASVIFLTGLGENPLLVNEIKSTLPGLNYRILTKPCKRERLKDALDSFGF